MAIVSEVADIVLSKLRLGDGTPGAYILVGEKTDTNHPAGFTGHNHVLCKTPTLLVSKQVVDSRDVYVFNVLRLETTAHHERRSRGENPVWERESICLLDREGAAAQLHLTARYMSCLDVYSASAATEFKDNQGMLPPGTVKSLSHGTLTIKTIDDARLAIALLDARLVQGL
jgi:hypothetical protein